MDKWLYDAISTRKYSNISKKLYSRSSKELRDITISSNLDDNEIKLDIDAQKFLSENSLYESMHDEESLIEGTVVGGKVVINSAPTESKTPWANSFIRTVSIEGFDMSVKPTLEGESLQVDLRHFTHDPEAKSPYIICDYKYRYWTVANEEFLEVTITRIESIYMLRIQDVKKDYYD